VTAWFADLPLDWTRDDTNMEPGSSGSPVFNRDFRIVALHNSGSRGTGHVHDGPLGRREPKDLQNLLFASMTFDIALYHAENVGLRVGQVDRGGPPELRRRELVKALAIAGLLSRFLQEIASLPEYDGIEPQLRRYL
jgi:hypothetical protein